jgi:CDP-diacylglycerol--glycerol-3-phosphate 3-phosphatidyltransferase
VAWSRAFDGYDLRHAPPFKRRFMRVIYEVTGVVPVKPSSAMLVSIACSLSVPVLAWRAGLWPLLAVAAVLLSLVADGMTSALGVRAGRITRLESFYQAMVERLAEGCWLVAFLLLGAGKPAVVVCAALVWAHEYVRAKVGGTAMRRAASATVGDRPLRVWLVIIALVLSACVSIFGQELAAGIVTMVVLCWVALALIGLGQLFAIIRKVLA